MVMGSEAGMVSISMKKCCSKGRLGPGKIIAIDTKEGKLLDNDEVKAYVAGLGLMRNGARKIFSC